GGPAVYVTTRRGTIDAVDITSRQVRQLLAGGSFGTMDFDEISGEVYVPDAQHNLLDVLAPVGLNMAALPEEPERVIHLSLPPISVAITNDGQLGFVALRGGKVAMIDLLERQIIYTVLVTGSPHFIITGLYPPAFIPTSSTKLALPQTTSSSILPKIVFPALLIVIVVLALFLAWQIRIFLRSGIKNKQRR
ncbi:MAG TPA: hypothetical protein VJO32_09955, partial [Ktedonobacteraceae bacterium]|nr:hypothetical protein [Ktedonobacteraceae bacterium]